MQLKYAPVSIVLLHSVKNYDYTDNLEICNIVYVRKVPQKSNTCRSIFVLQCLWINTSWNIHIFKDSGIPL